MPLFSFEESDEEDLADYLPAVLQNAIAKREGRPRRSPRLSEPTFPPFGGSRLVSPGGGFGTTGAPTHAAAGAGRGGEAYEVHRDAGDVTEASRTEDRAASAESEQNSAELVPPPPALPSFRQSTEAKEEVDSAGHLVVNQYVVVEQVGSGTYGEVFRTRSRADGKFYAMKILHRSILKRKRIGRFGNALESVKREVAVWKKLHHPHVVRLIEVIDDPSHDNIYMISEFVPGGALLPDAKEVEPLPEEEARHYFAQLVEALSYLHFQKVIHRDIKPGNLVVDRETRILKVADFGVSQMYEGEDDKIRSTAGTAAFMAPEMATGSFFSGRKVDVWAAGVSLYMMLVGRPPFSSRFLHEILDMIQEQEVTFPEDRPIGTDARDLILRLMTKDPEQRPNIDDIRSHPFFRDALTGQHMVARSATHRRLAPTVDEVDTAISPILAFRGIVRAKRISMMMLSNARRRLATRIKIVGAMKAGEAAAQESRREKAVEFEDRDDLSPIATPPRFLRDFARPGRTESAEGRQGAAGGGGGRGVEEEEDEEGGGPSMQELTAEGSGEARKRQFQPNKLPFSGIGGSMIV